MARSPHNATYQGLQSIRTVLGHLLDGLAGSDSDPGDYFKHVIGAWLAEREDSKTFDWRYYLVKYPSMRTGATGIYYGVDGWLAVATGRGQRLPDASLGHDPTRA